MTTTIDAKNVSLEKKATSQKVSWEQVKVMAQELGIAKDSQRFQLLEKIFNPDIEERLTVIPTREGLVHLNYMKHLAIFLGVEYGAFIESLYKGEMNLWRSYKGVSLDKFTNILEQQSNASEITVRNQSIPQQIAEPKKGLWSRITGRGSEE